MDIKTQSDFINIYGGNSDILLLIPQEDISISLLPKDTIKLLLNLQHLITAKDFFYDTAHNYIMIAIVPSHDYTFDEMYIHGHKCKVKKLGDQTQEYEHEYQKDFDNIMNDNHRSRTEKIYNILSKKDNKYLQWIKNITNKKYKNIINEFFNDEELNKMYNLAVNINDVIKNENIEIFINVGNSLYFVSLILQYLNPKINYMDVAISSLSKYCKIDANHQSNDINSILDRYINQLLNSGTFNDIIQSLKSGKKIILCDYTTGNGDSLIFFNYILIRLLKMCCTDVVDLINNIKLLFITFYGEEEDIFNNILQCMTQYNQGNYVDLIKKNSKIITVSNIRHIDKNFDIIRCIKQNSFSKGIFQNNPYVDDQDIHNSAGCFDLSLYIIVYNLNIHSVQRDSGTGDQYKKKYIKYKNKYTNLLMKKYH